MTNEPRHMEFLVVRYALMDGQIPVGVVLFEIVRDRIFFAKARFIEDMQKVLDFDPDADLAVLRSIFRDIESKVNDPAETMEVLGQMQGSFSNLLQVSDNQAVLVAGDPVAELDLLASMYLSSVPSN